MINMPSAEELRQIGKYDLEKEMEKLRNILINEAKIGSNHLKLTSTGHNSSICAAILDNYDTIGPGLKELGYEINFTNNMKDIIIRWDK